MSTPGRRSSSLSANMSEHTLSALTACEDKPGLAFYVSYAHVQDVAAHLGDILLMCRSKSATCSDPFALPVLLSCTLSSLELVLELLYRSDVADRRPGTDKVGLGLLITDIVTSLSALVRVALGLSEASASKASQSEVQSDIHNGETHASASAYDPFDEIPVSTSDSSAPSSTSTSALHRLSDAASLDLLSSTTQSALRSVLAFLDDEELRRAFNIDMEGADADIDGALKRLRLKLRVFAPQDGNKHCSAAAAARFHVPYHSSACTIPHCVLSDHMAPNGSAHGPEDLTFQIPHVILELYFWYIEHVLFPLIPLENCGCDCDSSALILLGAALDVCTKVIGILDLMLLADFHPLRVAVHGSSGFYSMAFHRIRSWFLHAYRAASATVNLDHVHLCPEMYEKETVYLQRLDRASASFRTLSFRHYVLAQRTIGSNSMGSAGKTFEQMQSSFLVHPNAKSNDSKYRTHELTNVKYAGFVGLGVQAVLDNINRKGLDDSLASLNSVGFDESDGGNPPMGPPKHVLQELGRCFVQGDANGFVDLFHTPSCRIEHPPGTLPYLGGKVKAYFMNIQKRHPVIRKFSVRHAGDDPASIQICIDVEAELFEGTLVQYKLNGECILNKDSTKIARLALDGLPDTNKDLCDRHDQRVFEWIGGVGVADSGDGAGEYLHAKFVRPMTPAEVLAYELNKSRRSEEKVSDGLTIVARSMVEGVLPATDLVHRALLQVSENTLLAARTEVTTEGHFFVMGDHGKASGRCISLRVIESAESRFDCGGILNTQFNCDEGDMFRVIISKFDAPSGPSFELVTVIFHGICDAISVRDFHSQILYRLSLLQKSAKIPGCQSVLNERALPRAIAPPAAHYARLALNKRVSPASNPLPLPEPAPIHVPEDCQGKSNARSKAFTRKLSGADTRALLASCRKNGTTVHAAIGAASLLSADCGGSDRKVLTSAVDLRRRIGMPNSSLVYSVGGFDGSAAFEYNVDSDDQDFWGLARKIRSDLAESIDSGRLLSTYLSSVEGLVGAYKGGFLDGGTFGTVFLSNIGNEAYEKDIGPFRWTDFDYLYGQFLPGGPHYHITASTFNGSLTLNFLYVSPTIPDTAARVFVDSTMAALKVAGDNS